MDNDLATFAKNVRQQRRSQNISQEELAFRVGINQPYLSNIENGSRNPSLSVSINIAKALGVSLETLLK